MMQAAHRSPDPDSRLAEAIDWVLGDRQRQETRMQSLPSGDGPALGPGTATSLRIYVAARAGSYHLIDDRSGMPAEAAARVDLIEADYTSPRDGETTTASHGLERILCASECKGEMLYLLAQDNKQRRRCDYVAFIDDDVEVRVSELLAGAEQAQQRHCPIFQLQLSHDSHAVWPQLKQRPQHDKHVPSGFAETWSELRFVEIMAPVIAQAELDLGLLDLLAPLKSGFGWDFYLLPCLNDLYDDFQPGLYRGAVMRHRRPVNTGNATQFSNGLTAQQEEELIRASLILSLVELRQEALQQRGALLQRIGRTLLSLQTAHCSGLVNGFASGLLSITKRYWLCRDLEQQCQGLLEEQRRLQRELEQRDSVIQQQDEKQQLLLGQLLQRQDELERIGHQLAEAQLGVIERDQWITTMRQSATWKLGRLVLSPLRMLRALARRINSGVSSEG